MVVIDGLVCCDDRVSAEAEGCVRGSRGCRCGGPESTAQSLSTP